MQIRPGSFFGFALLLTSASAFAETATLSAVNDRAVLGNTGRVTIPVLKNDKLGAGKPSKIEKIGKPTFGTARRLTPPGGVGEGIIVYTAGSGFSVSDSFQYTIKNDAGGTATATVTIFGPRQALAGDLGTNILDPEGRPVGYLEMEAMRTGAFSGKIRIGTDEYSLLGSLDRNGRYTGFAKADGDQLPVSFQVTENGETTLLSCTFGTDGEWTATYEIGDLSKEELAALEGRYTVELPPPSGAVTDDDSDDDEDSSNGDIPSGSGWMIVEVNSRGEAGLKGRTGDGRSFSVKARVGSQGGLPVLPFYEAWSASVLGGTLRMGDNTVEGNLTWSRGESGEDRYPDGFDLTVDARGGRYVGPESGRRALATDSSDAGRATVTISGEGLEEFTRDLRLSENDEVTDLDDGDPIDLDVNRDSGTFSGKFRDPDDREIRVKFSGVLLQNEGRAVGLFEAKNKTGLIELNLGSDGDDEDDDDGDDDSGEDEEDFEEDFFLDGEL